MAALESQALLRPRCHLEATMGDARVTLSFEKKQSISTLQSTWNNLPNYMEVIYPVFVLCLRTIKYLFLSPPGAAAGIKTSTTSRAGALLFNSYYLTLSCSPRGRQGW